VRADAPLRARDDHVLAPSPWREGEADGAGIGDALEPEADATAGAFRQWIEAVWAIPVYLLALGGLFVVPRFFASLAVLFLLYNTAAAWLFAGATRYRIAFDFVLALLAGAAIDRLLARSRYTRSTPSAAAPAEN
jgi:hypothetical protein